MFDAKGLLDQFFGGQDSGGPHGARSGGAGDFIRGAGGGALAGTIASLLLTSKKGREIGGEALKLGGMAAVGALAYKAYNDWQAGKPASPAQQQGQDLPPRMLPAPKGTPFNPATDVEQQTLARKLLRAMIAAAKCDGHIDADEQARIFSELDKLTLSPEEKGFVMDELRAKLDIDGVASAASSPEEAAEIYAASLLAIEADTPAERGYLAMLAARLRLDSDLAEHLNSSVRNAAGKASIPAG